MMRIPARGIRVLWPRPDKFTRTTKSCGGKGTARPLSRGERLDPLLDRLLLFFWAHYIEDDRHLLCTGSLKGVTENKGDRCC